MKRSVSQQNFKMPITTTTAMPTAYSSHVGQPSPKPSNGADKKKNVIVPSRAARPWKPDALARAPKRQRGVRRRIRFSLAYASGFHTSAQHNPKRVGPVDPSS